MHNPAKNLNQSVIPADRQRLVAQREIGPLKITYPNWKEKKEVKTYEIPRVYHMSDHLIAVDGVVWDRGRLSLEHSR